MNSESDAMRQLKKLKIEFLRSDLSEVFMSLARRHGFVKGEKDANRNIKGLWDVSVSDEVIGL